MRVMRARGAQHIRTGVNDGGVRERTRPIRSAAPKQMSKNITEQCQREDLLDGTIDLIAFLLLFWNFSLRAGADLCSRFADGDLRCFGEERKFKIRVLLKSASRKRGFRSAGDRTPSAAALAAVCGGNPFHRADSSAGSAQCDGASRASA